LSKIKKTSAIRTGAIKKKTSDAQLKFSFRFFDPTDGEVCPTVFREGYTSALMQRLRDVSSWTVREFTEKQDNSLRNHPHDWAETSRPDGFTRLNQHYRDYAGWQFCLSANERGRVHGIIIDDTFYVIWLDQDHRLYAS
jgi:hypothetical protein